MCWAVHRMPLPGEASEFTSALRLCVNRFIRLQMHHILTEALQLISMGVPRYRRSGRLTFTCTIPRMTGR